MAIDYYCILPVLIYILGFVTKEEVTVKLFTEIAPKYADRNGGYTRVTKIGPRRGDGAETVSYTHLDVYKRQVSGYECTRYRHERYERGQYYACIS